MSKSWNRSDASTTRPSQPKKHRPIALITCGVIGLCIVGALLYIFFPRQNSQETQESSKPSGRIKTVTPVATSRVETVAKPEIPYWEVDVTKTNGFTRTMQKKWEQMHRPKMPLVNLKPRKAKSSIFEHKSENLIASLLVAKPGHTTMIGRPNYKNINEDFLKSCTEPIIVRETDSEYDRDLKRAMNEVKADLKPRIDAGEDLAEIIEQSRAELRQLVEYKRTLTKEVMDMIRKEASTVEDVDSFVEAANKMLEQKGVAPLKLSTLTKYNLIQNKGGLE